MHVPLETLRRAAQLLDSLEDVDRPAEAPHLLLPGLAELVGCDALTYNEIEADPDQLSYYADYPVGFMDQADREVFDAHLHEHPVLRHIRAMGDAEPAKISDFLSRQEFRRLGLYSEFYRHVPLDDQISLTLPAKTNGQVIAIALNRAGTDFTEADRDVLSAIAGPLSNAVRRGRSRHHARTALAAASLPGPAELTEREFQVLQLAAQGRTNFAIARAMSVSPRTIAKHLEHIYRKLGVTSRAAAVYATATAVNQGPAA